jgi:type VI secretion system protein ImpB
LESIHEKLERVRKPRVHIKYEVETEGAVVEKELPFVVGVLGDFSGNPTQPLKPFGERKFIQIDRDNFDEVMRRMTPGLNFRVENTLAENGGTMSVSLKFEKLSDFEPGAIVEQVPALKALLESRNQLRDLLSKADRSESLETLLEQILQNQSDLKKLASELNARSDGQTADSAGSADKVGK